jgi:RNA ligase (TIGR02306 family)
MAAAASNAMEGATSNVMAAAASNVIEAAASTAMLGVQPRKLLVLDDCAATEPGSTEWVRKVLNEGRHHSFGLALAPQPHLGEVTRALASVRRVSAVLPIDGADRLELALIDGWQVVVAKADGIAAGDLVAYFEIDAFLPEAPWCEFLRASCFRRVEGLGAGFRIKTTRLRGALSQGLVLPLRSLPAGTPQAEGADLAAALGVLKYEPPSGLPPTLPRGSFPAAIPKTDQERVQNVWARLPRCLADTCEVTLKLDGTSCTAYCSRGEVGVCSRNLEVKLEAAEDGGGLSVYAKLGLPVAEKLRAHGLNYAVQGEIMGPGIQGNREKLLHHRLFVFDVWDLDAQAYLPPRQRRDLCERLGLDHVPVIDEALDVLAALPKLADVLAYAKRPSLAHKVAEGVVFKSNDGRCHFKAVSNEFLLKYEA